MIIFKSLSLVARGPLSAVVVVHPVAAAAAVEVAAGATVAVVSIPVPRRRRQTKLPPSEEE